MTKAWSDPDFKARLLADPKAVLAEAGVQVPDGIHMKIIEDTSDVINIVLPASPAGGAVSEQDMEQIAGGTLPTIYLTCRWVC